MISAVGSVPVFVSDQSRAVEFYTARLGFVANFFWVCYVPFGILNAVCNGAGVRVGAWVGMCG
jgi:catechol 2,3-dioxygenase-like lactoylglutathione lyase family enzyme